MAKIKITGEKSIPARLGIIFRIGLKGGSVIRHSKPKTLKTMGF
tara:strand:+ start:43744 stop:43875 length:132 start_codon:yes stop_codon:yes gene_type:complete